MIQPLWRTVWRFLKKLGIQLPYGPAIPLLGICPEKIIIEENTCTPMFIAALFIIARTWKQPRCPSTDEWIKKLWYLLVQFSSSVMCNFLLPCGLQHTGLPYSSQLLELAQTHDH